MENVIKIYEDNGALLRGHFLLSSGLHSDMYLQSELVMKNPALAAEVVSELTPKLKELDFAIVVSPAIGGIRFGYELARQMGKLSMFTERVDGVMTFRRGFTLNKGDKVLIAEDVVTTGKSTKECAEAVERAGGEVVAITSIIDRSEGQANFKYPYKPLVSVSVKTWDAATCPLCKDGGKAIKPGSRKELD